jgi:RNA ligase
MTGICSRADWTTGSTAGGCNKSFSSDVVRLTEAFVAGPAQRQLVAFATEVAKSGCTAVFELTHPLARIVVAHPRPALRLLHVRDNVTGEYVLLDPTHPVHELVRRFEVAQVPRFEGLTLEQALASLESMNEQEGYVLQFADGDMVKLKCP